MPTIRTISARRRRLILVSLYVGAALTGGTWLLSCGRSAARPAEWLLVVSGDTQGWITPCGCTVNQSGGLPRRGTYLAGLRQKHTVVYADVGGAADGITPYHAAKLSAIVKGEVAMQVAAHNLGGSEVAMGPAMLRDVQQATDIPWVSANAAAIDGQALADPIRIVSAEGTRVGLIGVVSPRYATREVSIAPPKDAILQTLSAYRGKFDRLVILAYLNDEELEALARELPEADAIIGGPTGQSLSPHQVGPALLASATNKGKFLVEASLDQHNARIVELNEQFGDALLQLQNLAAYRNLLRVRDFPASITRLAPGAQRLGQVAGSDACLRCHPGEHASWSATGHARAWQSLIAKGSQVDPSCQVCHTVNYGAPGGFSSVAASSSRVDVGCESCHGPAADHVANPRMRTPFLAMAQCRSCHDEENSPNFDTQSSWRKIRHGKSKEETL